MIPEEKVAEVRQSAKISDFISPHVALKRRGRSLLGLCPFHNEKTPSFSVNDEHGFYHCFGCSAGGNVFKFLMEIEQLSFPEAVQKVADRYGITVEHSGERRAAPRKGLFEVNASAARYFRRCLLETPPGKPVLDYLERRSIDEATAERFWLGAAPPSGDGLVRWLGREGIELESAAKLGLIGQRQGGGWYDRFRSRLMFPIRDPQGRVVGFGGRVIGEENGPKYLNSPESEIYHKGRALYGLYESRDALRDRGAVLFVEGYTDVIALHQAGIGHAVATCGTALTAEQANILRLRQLAVFTIFDGDSAGIAAAARSFALFVAAGMWPRGVSLPEGEDPDSFVRKHGADELERVIAAAPPLAEAYVRHAASKAPAGELGMAAIGAEIAGLLAKVTDPFAYDLMVSKASHFTGLSEEVLRRHGRPQAPTPPAMPRRRNAAAGAEELLVVLLLSNPEVARRVEEQDVVELMEDPVWKQLANAIIHLVRNGNGIDVDEALREAPGDLRARVLARLNDTDLADDDVRARTLSDCVERIADRARRRHNAGVIEQLRKREQLGAELQPAAELATWKPRNRSDA